MIHRIRDWNGEPVDVGYSRGGVLAIADVRRALIWRGEWPPPMLKRKLKRSRHARAFDDETRSRLERALEYYCDLQSIRSEDAITWSFFGTLANAPDNVRVFVMNWLLARSGIHDANETCRVELWKRLPHPDTGRAAHGPEPDFARGLSGRLLTARELAAQLGVSPGALLRWTRAKQVPAVKLPGGAVRYVPEQIDRWLLQCSTAGDGTEDVSPAPDVARQTGVSLFTSPAPLRPLAARTEEDPHAR